MLDEESTRRRINPGRAMMLGTGFLTPQSAPAAWVAVVGVVISYLLGFVIRNTAKSSPFFADIAGRRRPSADDT